MFGHTLFALSGLFDGEVGKLLLVIGFVVKFVVFLPAGSGLGVFCTLGEGSEDLIAVLTVCTSLGTVISTGLIGAGVSVGTVAGLTIFVGALLGFTGSVVLLVDILRAICS